jgi:putative cardiolipin synthase
VGLCNYRRKLAVRRLRSAASDRQEKGCRAEMSSLSQSFSSATEATMLDRLLDAQRVAQGESGARLLTDGLDAFALRVLSAQAARGRIDVQYYIWRSDATGLFLARELLRAADRGVQVRVLLDDMDARPRDDSLIALDRHAAVEIRLFNPFRTRRGWLRTVRELFSRGSRLNHRMHNKAWVVDDRIAIVGGRNIGDEYFAASTGVNFIDTDVALTGPAVHATSRSFEEYWACPASRPIRRLRRVGRRSKLTLAAVRERLDSATAELASSPYAKRLEDAAQPELLLNCGYQLESAHVEIVADDPRKALRIQPRTRGVLESMIDAVSAARRELLLISPYFVPGAGAAGALRDLTRRGVRVAVLTNSLAATDVAAVHSGYARYRKALLEDGVDLHELKSAISPEEEDKRIRIGSSRASLHTKAAIVDEDRIFVGSFNLDPRSAELNCEMGAWIASAPLVRQLRSAFETGAAPANSFTVELDDRGRTRWIEVLDGRKVVHDREPHAGWGRRIVTWLLGLLPIESQL